MWLRDVLIPDHWLDLRGTAQGPVRAAAALQAELERELTPVHPLAGSRPKVIARSAASDDVLVQLADGRAALVPLTWARTEGQPQRYPATTFVQSQQDFDDHTGDDQRRAFRPVRGGEVTLECDPRRSSR